MTKPTLTDILEQKRILILCGTGGVGKTSVSASIAIFAANLGKRVLVLTIDPSKRLAQTLGMESEEDHKQLPASVWSIDGLPLAKKGGQLSGMILNPKRTFDEVIRRFAETPKSAQAILANPIYQHLSGILAGSQEYMAMEKLLEIVEGDKTYDLIILDTPPSHHVLDFLEAPQKMVRAVSDSVLKYFLRPGLFLGNTGIKLLKKGPRVFFSFLDKVVGVSFLDEVSELLVLAQGLLDGFSKRAHDVEKLLQSNDTGFLMVTSLSPWAVHDAKSFYTSLVGKKISLSGIVMNRTIPLFEWSLSSHQERVVPKELLEAGKIAHERYHLLYEREQEEEAELSRSMRPKQNPPFVFLKIPLFEHEVHDVKTLKLMTMQLAE